MFDPPLTAGGVNVLWAGYLLWKLYELREVWAGNDAQQQHGERQIDAFIASLV